MNYDEKKEQSTKKEEIFNVIEMQINKMDNKAGLMISAIGIVFALTLELFSIFLQEGFSEANNCYKFLSYFFAAIYVTSFILSMLFLILVIFPRKNKKQKTTNKETFHINYYYDLSELQRCNSSNKENRDKIFLESLNEEIISGENFTNQIFTNADICRKKHDNLIVGITILIPFAASLVGLIVLLIVGV